MTVLSATQDAARLMGLGARAPSALFTSTDDFARELLAVAKETATTIARQYDWRKFTTLNTIAGDGSATAFDLPADYDRMPVKASVFLSSTQCPRTRIDDLDVWMDHRLRGFDAGLGEWIILGGQMQIYPVLSVGQSAQFYYQSSGIVVESDDTTTKATFTADTDSFRLPERLLSLGVIWRWRAMKGLDYSEEMQNFNIAASEEIARDKGSRMIVVGRQRVPAGVTLAWPGTINA